MLQIFSFLSAFAADRREKGATATEYALIIAGIAVVLVGAMTLFGDALEDLWAEVTGALNATP